MSVGFRRAAPDDVEFLFELANDGDVRPFLGVRTPAGRDELLREIERSEREPGTFGRFVIEVDVERAGSLGFHVLSEPNRIARVERLAVHPRFRGRRIADEAARAFQRHLLLDLGYHRLEMEIYGFNERAQAHAERAGWVKEGVKRRAYLRGERWEDGVLYSLLREDVADE